MREKKKGPAGVNQTDPRCKDESKHLLELRIKEVQSQESLLLFLFVESQPPVVSEPMLDAVWRFMEFLKASDYHVINGKEVFCFPFGKMVELSKLK
ncbi:hypothetical protein ES705_16384 [subsurface metagenome]